MRRRRGDVADALQGANLRLQCAGGLLQQGGIVARQRQLQLGAIAAAAHLDPHARNVLQGQSQVILDLALRDIPIRQGVRSTTRVAEVTELVVLPPPGPPPDEALPVA